MDRRPSLQPLGFYRHDAQGRPPLPPPQHHSSASSLTHHHIDNGHPASSADPYYASPNSNNNNNGYGTAPVIGGEPQSFPSLTDELELREEALRARRQQLLQQAGYSAERTRLPSASQGERNQYGGTQYEPREPDHLMRLKTGYGKAGIRDSSLIQRTGSLDTIPNLDSEKEECLRLVSSELDVLVQYKQDSIRKDRAIAALQREVAELRSKATVDRHLTDALQNLELKHGDAEAHIYQLEAQNGELNSLLDAAQREGEKLEAAVASMKEDIEAKDAEISKLKSEKTDVLKLHEEAKLVILQKDVLLAQRDGILADKSKEIDRLKGEIAALNEKLGATEKACEEKMSNAQSTTLAKEEIIKERDTALFAKDEAISRLEAENKSLMERNEQLGLLCAEHEKSLALIPNLQGIVDGCKNAHLQFLDTVLACLNPQDGTQLTVTSLLSRINIPASSSSTSSVPLDSTVVLEEGVTIDHESLEKHDRSPLIEDVDALVLAQLKEYLQCESERRDERDRAVAASNEKLNEQNALLLAAKEFTRISNERIKNCSSLHEIVSIIDSLKEDTQPAAFLFQELLKDMYTWFADFSSHQIQALETKCKADQEALLAPYLPLKAEMEAEKKIRSEIESALEENRSIFVFLKRKLLAILSHQDGDKDPTPLGSDHKEYAELVSELKTYIERRDLADNAQKSAQDARVMKLEAKIKELEKSVENARNDLSVASLGNNEQIRALNASLQSVREEAKTASDDFAKAKGEIAGLKEELSASLLANTMLKENITALNKTLDSYKKEVELTKTDASKTKDQSRDELKKLQYECEALTLALETEKSVSDRLRAEVQALSDKARSDMDFAKTEFENASVSLVSMRAQNSELASAITVLRQRLEEGENHRTLTDKERTIGMLRRQILELQARMSDLKAELGNELKNRIHELEVQNRILKEMGEAAQLSEAKLRQEQAVSLSLLKAQLTAREATIKELKEQLEVLKLNADTNKAVELQRVHMEATIAEKESRIVELEGLIDELTKKLFEAESQKKDMLANHEAELEKARLEAKRRSEELKAKKIEEKRQAERLRASMMENEGSIENLKARLRHEEDVVKMMKTSYAAMLGTFSSLTKNVSSLLAIEVSPIPDHLWKPLPPSPDPEVEDIDIELDWKEYEEAVEAVIRASVQAMQKQINAFPTQIEDLKKKNKNELEKAQNTFDAQLKALEAQFKQLQGKLSRKDEILANCDNELKSIGELRDKCEEANRRSSELEREIERLKNKLKEQKGSIDTLKHALEEQTQLNKALAGRQAAEIPIPKEKPAHDCMLEGQVKEAIEKLKVDYDHKLKQKAELVHTLRKQLKDATEKGALLELAKQRLESQKLEASSSSTTTSTNKTTIPNATNTSDTTSTSNPAPSQMKPTEDSAPSPTATKTT